jgi:uroporphyrinogen decarboxylase
MTFEPDYRIVVDAATNKKPSRLPIYEHAIDERIMATVLDVDMSLQSENISDLSGHYAKVCQFWKNMTYDTVSFEAQICPILPDHGAILGGRPGPIQNREDFEKYPFSEFPEIFWNKWEPHLQALSSEMPNGMKALGGCGYGIFEISEDLVGFEYLCLLQQDDPELFSDLFLKIGDLMITLWSRLLDRFGDLFAVCRMGDDLGFKSSTLMAPTTIIQHILPQYRRIIALVHGAGKPFLLHSCGKIFSVMEEIIATGIDAKHSNEDQIAPFAQWIERYNDRIGLFGGIDVDLLCRNDPKTVYEEVLLRGTEYRRMSKGFALGSGNSIPHYVPADSYLAMIDAAREIRRRELNRSRPA